MAVAKSFILSSMTGQAESSEKNEFGEVHVQIKSLNHRFRDFKFRAPISLQMAEITLRKIIESNFKRGSFDINISIKYHKELGTQTRVNLTRVSNYLKQFSDLNFPSKPTVDLTAFLRQEFTDEVDDTSNQAMNLSLHRCFNLACIELREQRHAEGKKIRAVLLKLHEQLLVHLNLIIAKQHESLENKKAKLKSRLDELKSTVVIDEQRLAQEFVYLAQKLDIQEEIDRFRFHWKKLATLLEENYDKVDRGKELEFILQELGRETNTLSNKADHSQISHECVSLKVLLENIKEQILNLE
jgi:uncharacterized protein (TIGR00255 family)